MVSIFTGAGAGFTRGSGNILGGGGLLGSGSLGRNGENVSVNAATGNLLIAQQDEFLIGRGLDISIARTYNSMGDATDGDNGDNWQQSTTRRVFELTGTLNTAGSTIKRQGADGAVILYTWNATKAAYVSTDGDGAHDELKKVGATWVWTEGSSRFTDTYSAYGTDNWRITSATEKEYFGLTYTYVADKLDKVTTTNGEWTQYGWSGNNITQILTGYTDLATSTAATLTRTRYAYDGSNRLTSVTVDLSPGDSAIADGNTFVTTYTYDGASTRVASIGTTGGAHLAITYDGSGRVYQLKQTSVTGVTRDTTLDYQTNYTNITGPDGQVTRLDYDAAKRLTKITAPPAVSGATAQDIEFAYDADGNVTSVTDAANKVTSYTYDASGNVLTTTDPNSNVVTRTYSAKNELLTETRTGSDATGAAVNHTTRYAYNAASQLRYIVSAEGYVTEFEWSGANQYWTTEFPQQVYDVSALADNAAITESQLTTWRTTFNNTRDKITVDQFDTRGNLIKRTRYGSGVTNWGNGSTAEGYSESFYSYDQAGRLLSRYDNGVLAETYVYDGLGRVTASTSPSAGTTTIVFNDGALTTTVTTATGYSSVSTYNKAGDLLSEAHSGSYDVSGTTAFKYDALGRVRMITTPLGVASTGNPNDYNSFVLYDHAGRKTADIAADGSIVEYRYDAAGRLAATIAYATKLNATQMGNLATAGGIAEVATYRPTGIAADIWNWSVYDDAGRLIQSIDGNGGVVDFFYDGSNRLINTTGYSAKLTTTTLDALKATLPTSKQTVPTGSESENRVSRTFYDKDGRVVGALNGEGYLTEIVYDKAGQKVEEIAYSTRPAVSWTTSSFNQLRTSAGTSVTTNRRMRYVYDGQGLLRYQVDNLGFVSSFSYDLAQQPTTTISYATAISPADYTYATVKAAVAAIANDATDRESYSVFNNKGQIAYTIDAGGLVTSFAYDAGGRAIKTVQFATSRGTSTLPTLATMDSWAAGAGHALDRVSRTYYSAGGVARFTVDAEGYRTKSVFDANGNLLSTTLSANALTVIDSTTIAQLDALSGGTALTTSFTYDPTGRLLTMTNAEAGVTTYEYNAFGQVAKITDPRGQSTGKATYNYYDAAGRLAMVRDAEDYVTQTTYNSFGEVASVTRYYNKTASAVTVAPTVTSHVKDAVTFYYYDDLGRLTYTVDAEKGVTRSYYNGFGEVSKVVRYATTYNATAATTIAQLDANFGAESAAPPGTAAITSFTYDNGGRVITSTDAEGWFESYGYDVFGNRTSVVAKSKDATKVAGGTTTYSYDKRGLLTSETLPISSYLANGSVQGVIVNTYGYDAFGNRTQMVEGSGLAEARTTTYEYDRLGRLTKTIGQMRTVLDQANHTTTDASFVPEQQIAYDAAGNVTSITTVNGTTDAVLHRTVYFYDDIGRKIVEINAAGTYTRYAYDANGNVTSTRVYETVVTVPANGGSDTLTAANPPGAIFRETLFEYDNLGRLKKSSVVAAAGTGYTLTTGSYSGGVWTSATTAIDLFYEYDAFGNVVKTIDGNGTANGSATWSYYDRLGRKTTQVDTLNYRTDWTYDGEGNVLSETRYANAAATPSSTATPPSVTTNSTHDRVTSFTYDKLGNRLSETRSGIFVHNGSGANEATAVDATIRWLYNGLGQVVRKFEATDNAAISTDDNAHSTRYTYDVGGRLITEQRAEFTSHQSSTVTPTVDYRYNGLGDLVRTVAAGAGDAAERVTTHSYGAGGLLATTTDAEGIVHTYSYDTNGTLIRDEYNRADSAGTVTLNAVLTKVDVLGRTVEQSVAWKNGSVWVKGDIATTEYNAYGEVARTGLGGIWQQENKYDVAGRVWATNSGDGVWKVFGYDKNGNQTLAIALAGAGDTLAGNSFATAFGKIGQENVNATYTVYDKRNMATSVVEEQRRLKAGADGDAVQTITTGRAYNAFGETLTETNARGGVTSYSYNKMGRVVRSEGPAVAITLENGKEIWVKPSQDFYYDRAGRLVAQRDANGSYAETGTGAGNATSKTADTGNLTRLTLLAGTGYGGSQALVTAETQADGGVKTIKYDVHGDARLVIDAEGRETAQSFDKLARLSILTHPGASGLRLVERFAYDGLGQRLRTWNNLVNPGNTTDGLSGEVQTTDYDIQGRVIATRAYGGDVTSTSYVWSATIAAISGTVTGGWTETVRMSDSAANLAASIYKQSVEKSDIFGRVTEKTDLGGHVTTYAYDAAGRQTSATLGSTVTSFTWFNTGRQATSAGLAGTATYRYDLLGNRTYEKLELGGATIKEQAADYDVTGRMTAWSSIGTTTLPSALASYRYDANGNIRATLSQYMAIDEYGAPTGSMTTKDYWFRYDSMNRVVTDKGQLSGTAGAVGTTIIRGSGGIEYEYNEAGDRMLARSTRPVWQETWHSQPIPGEPEAGFYTWDQVDGVSEDSFTYDAAGRLYQVFEASVIRSDFAYDLMGRVTLQRDYGGLERAPGGLTYSRGVTYNAKGQVSSDDVSTRRDRNQVYTPGATIVSDVFRNVTTYTYGAGSTYAFGSVLTATVTAYKNDIDAVSAGSGAPDTLTTTTYEWWDGAVQKTITHDFDTGSSGTDYTTIMALNALGQLTGADVNDGVARDVVYKLDENGQIIRRDESRTSTPSQAAPHEIFYRFAGKQMGMLGNNGTADTGYSESVVERSEYDEPATSSNAGLFRDGTKTGASFYADFAQSLTPTNSHAQGSSGGTYTVRAGDTLASIAQMLWGDANLWYKLAEANGLSGQNALTEGQALTLPAGVTKNTHSADTFKPYDPMDAIGDLSPTTPKPPKKPKCGTFAMILVAIVAIAVTAVATAGVGALATGQSFSTAFGAMFSTSGLSGLAVAGSATATLGTTGAIAAGVAGAVVGSIASQGLGIAMGVQDGFSWKNVALAGLGAGIGGALGGVNAFGTSTKLGTTIANAAVRGALGSALTQGIGRITGLQSKFDFAGVAAAGIGAGVGEAVGGLVGGAARFDDTGRMISGATFGNAAASISASGIANAATRSAINGENFGRNLLASIPDIMAQVVMRAVGTGFDDEPAPVGGGGGSGPPLAGGKLARMSAALAPSSPLSNLMAAQNVHQSASYMPNWVSWGMSFARRIASMPGGYADAPIIVNGIRWAADIFGRSGSLGIVAFNIGLSQNLGQRAQAPRNVYNMGAGGGRGEYNPATARLAAQGFKHLGDYLSRDSGYYTTLQADSMQAHMGGNPMGAMNAQQIAMGMYPELGKVQATKRPLSNGEVIGSVLTVAGEGVALLRALKPTLLGRFSYTIDEVPTGLVADSKGVYGYMPAEGSEFSKARWGVDWSDAEAVSNAQKIRLAYHEGLEAEQAFVSKLTAKGVSTDDVARQLVDLRNQKRISSYTDDQIDTLYQRNIERYGNKYGPTYESQLAKYGSAQAVIDAALRSNKAMDVLTGIARIKK